MTTDDSTRLLTWNVHKCRGTDGRKDPDRILSVIASAKPDIAVLQEAERRFGRRKGLLHPEEITKRCGLRLIPATAGSHLSYGWRGNAVLVGPDIEMVSTSAFPLPGIERRGAVIWRMRKAGKPLIVVGVHLSLIARWRHLQARTIANRIASEDPVPTVIAGDMNEWRRDIRSLLPIEKALGTAPVGGPSFPSGWPVLALDRIAAGRGAKIESWSVLKDVSASDHLPLMAKLRI